MNNLKKIRKNSKKTQQEIADFLNVARNTYSRYERDIFKMDHETLIKLSRYFNVSVDYIIGNIKEPVTLDELRFLKEMRFKTNEELMEEYNIHGDDEKKLSKEEILKMLEQIRASIDD